MSLISWNCQGSGSDLTIQILREMRRDHFPNFMFLMETKNSSNHVLGMKRSLGYDKNHIVEPEGLRGGLALFWKTSYNVDVLSSDKRIIDVKVSLGSLEFFISFVYGDPVKQLRQVVWDKLVDIGSFRNDAWLVIGDLNELIDSSEKLGGPRCEEASFYPFCNMISDCGLREVPSSGNKFSWVGERNKMRIQCRLDRVLGNTDWFHLLPRVHAEYMARIGSDHRPILLRFANNNLSRTGRFMFDKRWVKKPEVKEVIKHSWSSCDNGDSEHLLGRISFCRRALSKWKLGAEPNSKTRIRRLKEKIDEEDSKISPNMTLLKELKRDLGQAYRNEEIYWRHKSKDRLLKDGDRNTNFFHGSVKKRRAQNNIPVLTNSDGVEQLTKGLKGEIAVDYFWSLFMSSNPVNVT
ncbi:hypothetical protein V5N11_003718 [Cardamine amara subsp. amara]|uniref:Endonuclease/exonuclease/phosphatase domain-containing protein n=1 Tax=Cardamine amara subsp. amara TaxID=228776 RepID=A0ABD1AFG9_CARAN